MGLVWAPWWPSTQLLSIGTSTYYVELVASNITLCAYVNVQPERVI